MHTHTYIYVKNAELTDRPEALTKLTATIQRAVETVDVFNKTRYNDTLRERTVIQVCAHNQTGVHIVYPFCMCVHTVYICIYIYMCVCVCVETVDVFNKTRYNDTLHERTVIQVCAHNQTGVHIVYPFCMCVHTIYIYVYVYMCVCVWRLLMCLIRHDITTPFVIEPLYRCALITRLVCILCTRSACVYTLYIYIYIYVCVCVCVCLYTCT